MYIVIEKCKFTHSSQKFKSYTFVGLQKLLTKFYFLLLPEPIKRTVSIPLCSYKAGESKGCELARVYPVLVQVPDI